MVRVQHISKPCVQCRCERDHVQLEYINETVFACMHCQHDEVIPHGEEDMKRSFKILEMEEKEAGQRKKVAIVTLERTVAPQSGTDHTVSGTEIIKVSYPVWEGRHMASLVKKYPGGSIFDYVEAREIADTINKLVSPTKEPDDG